MDFFLKHAVERFHERDAGIVDYYIVVNDREHPGITFPQLCNVWVVKRPNSMDFCSYREVLGSGLIDLRQYDYFFFMLPSLLGPILPNYWIESWWKPFVNVLRSNDNIKLVGPYVSCEITPHVQGMMFVTDPVGLEIIKDTWGCASHDDTIHQMEVPQSIRVRDAGYEIASLMHVYNLVKFTATSTCNDKSNPFIYGVKRRNYFPSLTEMIFVRRATAPEETRAIYDSYMAQVEHFRINCFQCWKDSNCKMMCSQSHENN